MTTITGNILDIKSGIIAHQVNCLDRMGAGIAGQIIKKYPSVLQKYHRLAKAIEPSKRFGKIQKVPVTEELTIANVFSQFAYGNPAKTGKIYTNANTLSSCLHKLCHDNPNKTIYIPYNIGCGLGGETWDHIEPMIKDIENLTVVKLP